jgi:hypothetical protein
MGHLRDSPVPTAPSARLWPRLGTRIPIWVSSELVKKGEKKTQGFEGYRNRKKRSALAFHASHPRSHLGVALINTVLIDWH